MGSYSEYMLLDSSRVCPVCQREFVTATDEYVYKRWTDGRKRKTIWFCSYGCMRKFDRGETDLTGRGVRLSEKKRKIWQALDDGLTVREIAVLLDITPKQVSYYKTKWVPRGGDDA